MKMITGWGVKLWSWYLIFPPFDIISNNRVLTFLDVPAGDLCPDNLEIRYVRRLVPDSFYKFKCAYVHLTLNSNRAYVHLTLNSNNM